MLDIKESDWKIFKQIKEKAIEMFCQKALDDFEKVIKNESEHVQARYGKLYTLVRDRDKTMARLFDPHSRSKATRQLIEIREAGFADETLLNQLSKEYLEFTDPRRLEWD